MKEDLWSVALAVDQPMLRYIMVALAAVLLLAAVAAFRHQFH